MGVVLIVEDDEQVRVFVESAIQEISHSTLTASNVEEALALLRDEQQQIDLLFTDIRLWDEAQGGITLAQEARGLRPGIRVLYTTGEGVTDGMRALFVDGFLFLAKPYNLDALRALIREQLG
jgi:DNA-binding NtrC family response regulator